MQGIGLVAADCSGVGDEMGDRLIYGYRSGFNKLRLTALDREDEKR